MAKIFEEFQEPVKPTEDYFMSKRDYFFLITLVGVILIWGLGRIYLETKDVMPQQKSVVETIKMKKGYILVQEVKYETYKKIDPSDTGDIYFEVVKSIEEDYQEGDLVKFNPRFREKVEIETGTYCILDASQIQFYIKKEDVKTGLLKR
jgi:intein/homing endonuclease